VTLVSIRGVFGALPDLGLPAVMGKARMAVAELPLGHVDMPGTPGLT
jgi:hypothetical protein